MRSICLCMIVKNEMANIERCLGSLADHIGYWVIGDTGSTDGTQDFIKSFFAKRKIPGELHSFPFENFEQARNKALECARASELSFDYLLLTDADMELTVQNPSFWRDLEADAYCVEQRTAGGLAYWNARLLRRDAPARYRGVTHEFLDLGAGKMGSLRGISFIDHATGSNRVEKYDRDLRLLKDALATERDPNMIARYTFYLAQSYRDSGDEAQALVNYLKRSELGFWTEEVYYSLYQAAKLKENLGAAAEDVIQTYLKAAETSPGRAEALHGAARYCRLNGRHSEGHQYAKRALTKKRPDSALFSETWIYDYAALDEYAISCYWSGHHREAIQACMRLLSSTSLPASQRERVAKNAQYSIEKLPHDPNPTLFFSKDLVPGLHAPQPPRLLGSSLGELAPKILVAILAKQKEQTLPLYLRCLDALDYPKDRIVLYIRTNNNRDRTEAILADWIEKNQKKYAAIEFDSSDVDERVQDFEVHEWNALRFRVLGKIRRKSLDKVAEYDCDYYFTADIDNFLRPFTLRELVALNLPIVAPFLRQSNEQLLYSNYHADIDDQGYYRECDAYYLIWSQKLVGVFELPVVLCTYLVRRDVISRLSYCDATSRNDYVIFSDSARRAGVQQYLDNRQVYGYLTVTEEVEVAERLLAVELGTYTR